MVSYRPTKTAGTRRIFCACIIACRIMAPLQRGLAHAYFSMRCVWGIGCTTAAAACGLVDSEQEISFYCNKIPPAKILGIFATSLFKGGMSNASLFCVRCM